MSAPPPAPAALRDMLSGVASDADVLSWCVGPADAAAAPGGRASGWYASGTLRLHDVTEETEPRCCCGGDGSGVGGRSAGGLESLLAISPPSQPTTEADKDPPVSLSPGVGTERKLGLRGEAKGSMSESSGLARGALGLPTGM